MWAAAACSASHALLAQQPPPQKFIYPAPAPSQYKLQPDIVFRTLDATPTPSPVRELKFDLYLPTTPKTPRLPVIVFMNAIGGQGQRGWEIYKGWAKVATGQGFAAINADSHPGGVAEDLDALAGYLRQHAGTLHVDPDRIGVYAASSNAFNGLPIIQDPKRAWIKAAAIYYGAADIAKYRPEVPLLWVRAGLDRPSLNRSIDEAVALALRQNVTVSVINFAAGHHGFEVIDDNDSGREVIAETLQFFKRSLDPAWSAAHASGIRLAQAAGAVSAGDFDRAVTLYGELITEQSGANLRLAFGEALLGAKRYREATVQFDRAKKIGGLGPRDLGLPAARASALGGDADGAIAWLRSIPKRFLPASVQQDDAFAPLRARTDFQALFLPD